MIPIFISSSSAELLPSRSIDSEASKAAGCLEREVFDLFDSLRLNLLRYAVSLGLSIHDGEDIIQETFLALFHHLREGRSRSNLRGWLFSVAHNLALKRRAKNCSLNRICETNRDLTDEFSDSSPNPEEELLFTERQKRLLAVLRALPEKDRWCLQLRAEGLRYREISRVTGISLGSVSTSLRRSLARLARIDER
jgi:RNA polymerase sigma-70 factor (ECF subfamily)